MTRAMKDSGIEWIGEIPQDWEIHRNKVVFSCNKEIVGENSNNTQLLSLTTGGVKTKDINSVGGKLPESFDTYQYVAINNIIMCLFDLDMSAVFSGISNYNGMISPAYKVLKCNNNYIMPKYADYWFSFVFIDRKFTLYAKNLRYTLSYDEFGVLPITIPPMPEQQKIADFLDKKCSHIDSVLEKVRASIDEYKQLKQSVITQAVTKGIRPNRPMKDSGIEWIGEIPQDWKVIKGKNVLELLSKPVKETDTVITCFRDGEVTLRSKRREDGFTISLQEIGYQGIDIGDLVVHGMDGFAGAIGISDSRGKGTPVLSVLDSKQNKKYLMYYLRAMAFNGVFIALATGIRVRSCDTSWNKLKNLPYPIPTEDEQVEIVAYLDDKCSEIDKLITKKEQLIEELETYKKSLIYEYVTGKKEVK